MQNRSGHRAKIKSISFYLFLLITFLTFMLMISCNESAAITNHPAAKYFDSISLIHLDFHFSGIPSFGIDENPINAQQRRSLIFWYNESPSSLKVADIVVENNLKFAQDPVEVINVEFDPEKKGIYNSCEISGNPKHNWGGISYLLPDSIIKEFKKSNIVMKIWLNVSESPKEALLNIDLGQMSEEIIPNGRLDSEDKNNNDLLDDDEDTGIDGIFDRLEPDFHNDDPGNDNYFIKFGGSKENINGLENNKWVIGKLMPDSEDLNRNKVLDISNNYYIFQIPLDISKLTSNKITEKGTNGWTLIKIPIDLPDMKIGSPDMKIIESIRLWITNAESKVRLRIAQIMFDEI